MIPIFLILFTLYTCSLSFHDLKIGAKQSVMVSSVLTAAPKVALTRELGNNDKMKALLSDVSCIELPCIMFAEGLDYTRLTSEMVLCDVICVTSPQSAKVLGEAWAKSNKPEICVASVGKGTSLALKQVGISPVFEPSEATAHALAQELPQELGASVLYPTSNLALDTLQEGLEVRGFEVTRLNTYTTKPSKWTRAELDEARQVEVVAFASPSAVRTWAERVGTDFTAVVIGPTSAKVARELGFTRVASPDESKGVKAWADLIKNTLSPSPPREPKQN